MEGDFWWLKSKRTGFRARRNMFPTNSIRKGPEEPSRGNWNNLPSHLCYSIQSRSFGHIYCVKIDLYMYKMFHTWTQEKERMQWEGSNDDENLEQDLITIGLNGWTNCGSSNQIKGSFLINHDWVYNGFCIYTTIIWFNHINDGDHSNVQTFP